MMLQIEEVIKLILFGHILLVLANVENNLSTLNCEFTRTDIAQIRENYKVS